MLQQMESPSTMRSEVSGVFSSVCSLAYNSASFLRRLLISLVFPRWHPFSRAPFIVPYARCSVSGLWIIWVVFRLKSSLFPGCL